MQLLKRWIKNPFFVKLFNWEYWPFEAVYYPVMPIWIVLWLRTRTIYFFNASNPGIENGGLLNESKKDIHRILPADLYARTIHFPSGTNPDQASKSIKDNGLQYPLFGKPDIGGKGKGVKKIHNDDELREYASAATIDFHIQEAVPYEEEVGIFYYRYPGTAGGEITGIVGKEFLTVTGNGKDSIADLLMADQRASVYAERIKLSLGKEIEYIPARGEKKIVSPYGNHARGSKFIDVSHKTDKALTQALDDISARIPGFYFGRLDIRFSNWNDLRAGRNFKIIEINGAGAEPTHMYDPAHSIAFAWKEIIRHWWIMTTVSIKNHKLGVPYMSFREGNEMFRKYNELQRQIGKIPD